MRYADFLDAAKAVSGGALTHLERPILSDCLRELAERAATMRLDTLRLAAVLCDTGDLRAEDAVDRARGAATALDGLRMELIRLIDVEVQS